MAAAHALQLFKAIIGHERYTYMVQPLVLKNEANTNEVPKCAVP